MSELNDFIDQISQANVAFFEGLRRKYPDQVAKAIKIYGDSPSGWTFHIAGNARGLWERQNPRDSNEKEFKNFVANEFEEELKKLEKQGMPMELINAIFELGEIHTRIGAKHGWGYEGYGNLSRERG